VMQNVGTDRRLCGSFVLRQKTNDVIRLGLVFPETPYQPVSLLSVDRGSECIALSSFLRYSFPVCSFFYTPLSLVLAAWLFP
jgi:hypothetical protein